MRDGQPGQWGSGDYTPGQAPSRSYCCERVICSAQTAMTPETMHLLVNLRCRRSAVNPEHLE